MIWNIGEKNLRAGNTGYTSSSGSERLLPNIPEVVQREVIPVEPFAWRLSCESGKDSVDEKRNPEAGNLRKVLSG